jgi:hypothetical protein
MDVTGPSVTGCARIGIGHAGIADNRDPGTGGLSHAEDRSFKEPKIGIKRAEQRFERLPVAMSLFCEEIGQW